MTEKIYSGALRDRVAIVTGAGHGIGRNYARRFAREGAAVVLADIDGDAVTAEAQALKDTGLDALGVRADVREAGDMEGMVAAAKQAFGGVDILVNNAALFATVPMSRSPFDQIEVEEWD